MIHFDVRVVQNSLVTGKHCHKLCLNRSQGPSEGLVNCTRRMTTLWTDSNGGSWLLMRDLFKNFKFDSFTGYFCSWDWTAFDWIHLGFHCGCVANFVRTSFSNTFVTLSLFTCLIDEMKCCCNVAVQLSVCASMLLHRDVMKSSPLFCGKLCALPFFNLVISWYHTYVKNPCSNDISF